MNASNINVRFFDVVLCVSRALDLLSPHLSDHHLRTAYVAARLAEEIGLSVVEKQDVVIAGALHDVGALSTTYRLALQDYAVGDQLENIHVHGMEGYLLLREFPPFTRAAEAIRYHHVEWNNERGSEFNGEPVPLASHILHLADRIAVLPESGVHILQQCDNIRRKIVDGVHLRFHPRVVSAFDAVSLSEAFWLDVVSQHKEEIIRERFGQHNVVLDLDELYELARLFGRIIDFRSPFTAIHSSMVAARAERIAQLLGVDTYRTKIIGIAGFLHDLGKLAVPTEILDKPERLTREEMFIVKQHPYYTHRILSTVPGLEEVNAFASLHHERLDGQGYPFRRSEIPLEARIIAAADVFTAVSEHRPYRSGMTRTAALALLDQFVSGGALDGEVVAVVRAHFGDLIRMSQP
ncbi:HD-GYP domain-containing protein [Noviherbaspirillum sp.]|uniref:HD-GYP domain-containing protein n=1 Tax=Noviherbaspirillum sp. TaxID=1926288 RepID=UPI002B486516|nr:HD domain-containing phosphohydrolase [Noviherbaspirillum sp.]HJV81433.1 HD domain-containing phosphohydrolase [Noviherbaspirillum sp.]